VQLQLGHPALAYEKPDALHAYVFPSSPQAVSPQAAVTGPPSGPVPVQLHPASETEHPALAYEKPDALHA
jgi:hypothetical protein